MEHTPGKWTVFEVRPDYGDTQAFDVITAGSWNVAQVHYWGDYDARHAANACLIAAAPDLLAACDAIMADYDRVGLWPFGESTLEAIRAAIAKARGDHGPPTNEP